MKGLILELILLLLFLKHVILEPVGNCPSPDPLNRTEHLPDDKDCTKFWRCDHETPKQETCPDKLHFNPTLQVCDWPSNAGCYSGSVGTSTTRPPTPETSTSAATTQRSPTPELSTSAATPTHPPTREPSTSAATTAHPTTPEPSTSAATTTRPPKPELTTPAVTTSRPLTSEPTTSSATSARPPTPESSTTAATTTRPFTTETSAATTVRPPVDTICENATEDRWHLPHPTNCSKFYKCDLNTGKATEFECPDNLHFNSQAQVCDWPQQAGCESGSVGSTTARPPATEATTSAVTTSHPLTSESSTSAATTTRLPKPEPTTPAVTTSRPPTSKPTTSAATTARPPTREPSTSAATTARPSTSESSTSAATTLKPSVDANCENATYDRWHLPHPTDCSKFYKCDLNTGKATEFECPDNLHFNPQAQVCDWPQQAGCESGSVGSSTASPSASEPTTAEASTTRPTTPEISTSASTTTQPPTTAPSTSAATTVQPTTPETTTAVITTVRPPSADSVCQNATEDRWHLPHPTDCTKFFKCDLNTGRGTEFVCPDGLHFNSQAQVCDWPSYAGCEAGCVGSSTVHPQPEPTSAAITTARPPTPETSSSAATTTRPATPEPSTSAATTTRPPAPETTTVVVTTVTPPPTDSVCQNATEDRWHLPHPTDCTKFYKCDLNTGIATEFHCRDGLHFNAEIQVCDWPNQAGCRRRT